MKGAALDRIGGLAPALGPFVCPFSYPRSKSTRKRTEWATLPAWTSLPMRYTAVWSARAAVLEWLVTQMSEEEEDGPEDHHSLKSPSAD